MDEQLPPPYSIHDPTPRLPISTAHSRPSAPVQGSLHVSGAAYFEMRSPARPKPIGTLPIPIAVLLYATTAGLPMPEPKHILIGRDVESHDWSTFVNHLIPHESLQPSAGVKEMAADEKGRAGKPHRPMDILPVPTESERQHTVKAVVQGWNRAFFLPRGIEIVVQVEASPRKASLPELGGDS